MKVSKSKRGDVKKQSFYKAIFNMIRDGKSPSFISKTLKLPRQNIYYYTNKLKKWGLIEKVKKGEWRVLVKTFSMGVRDQNTDLHALNIKYPILSGKLNDSDWEIRNKLNNWIPKYKEFKEFGGITIRNNNNRSISVFIRPRKVNLLQDREVVKRLANNISIHLINYFQKEHGVILDSFNKEIKNIHLETKDDFLNLDKGDMVMVDLGRKSEKIFPKDNINAKAWADNSPDPNQHGTNDLLHKRRQLFMPEYVANIQNMMESAIPAIHFIAQNYASHVGIVEELHKLLKKPEVKREIKEKVKTNGQSTLKEWI